VISQDKKYLTWEKAADADGNLIDAKQEKQKAILSKLMSAGLLADSTFKSCINYTETEHCSSMLYDASGI